MNNNFKIHILGTGSAKPSLDHMPSSQILEIRGHVYMLDCGEGTQLTMQKSSAKWSKIESIFITHAHGDHCFGLIGLLSMFALLQRTDSLNVYIPQDLEDVLKAELKTFGPKFPYDINIKIVDTEKRQIIFEDNNVTVYSIPLYHRIPCCGFMFIEKPTLPHIIPEKMKEYNVPYSKYNNIKRGKYWSTPDGSISYKELTTPPDRPRSYAYCTDTKFDEQIAKDIDGVQVLFHDCTYEKADAEKATKYYHSTSTDASKTAQLAHIQTLIIGHYSSRYESYHNMLNEAQEIFPDTIAAYEGLILEIVPPIS